MPCVHEFGIIDNINNYQEDDYKPKKYKYIDIDDDFISEIYHAGFKEKIEELKTYFHSIDRPNKGLAWYGITLIPPSSHQYFLGIVEQENKKYKSDELNGLIDKIKDAIKQDKWMIHYGI